MPADDLEITAEFCALVGSPNLLEYLGLDENASTDDARTSLKARRKFMQGMQSNPKYKKEALFLIRHFTSLNDVLEDTGAYLADARRRSESVHLPVIEMTIRGVLATGTAPTTDQVDYLRRNALELGVTEETFRERLEEIAAESGVVLPGGEAPPTPIVGAVEIVPTIPPPPHSRSSLPPDVQAPPPPPHVPAPVRPPDLDTLPEAARYAPNDEAWGTVPRVRPSEALTIFLSEEPDEPAQVPRLEILGDPVRRLRLGARIPEIRLRNGGGGAMGGTVSTDVPWLKAHPTRLDPNAREQAVAVRISQKRLPDGPVVGSVVIATDNGERARVVYEIRRGPSALSVVAALLVMGTALAIAGWVLAQVVRSAGG